MNRNNRVRSRRSKRRGIQPRIPPTISISPSTSQRPPQYSANYRGYKVFRFLNQTVTTTTVYSITPSKLGSLIVWGYTTTVAQMMFDAVKLKYVEVWSLIPNTDNSTQIAVQFPGLIAGTVGDVVSRSDQSTGATWSAHVKVAPRRMSQSAQWLPTDNNSIVGQATIFTITVNSPVIVDVGLSFSVPSAARGSAGSVTLTTSAQGYTYYLALDNAAGSFGSNSSTFVPDASLNTTK